jgi:AraC family transcriptional regulator of adaptative response / DNA-3-methyladenine glycosylase II
VIESIDSSALPPADVCQRALNARDPRFDGLFFVGIVTTGVYCRPVCPTRRARPANRRFFRSAAAAEHAGFRPCLTCRPELAPGQAPVDAVPRLAYRAAYRIGAGALNDHSVADLAAQFGVSDRHLRRALQRELGVSPVELAQTHRLLLAKRLLADTGLPVTHIAYASGFQSLRRFNTVFRDRYRLSPSALRRSLNRNDVARDPRPHWTGATVPKNDLLRLTLTYRPPFAWDVLVTLLGRDALPGVEIAQGGRYGRTVRLAGRSGIVFAEDAGTASGGGATRHTDTHVNADVSPSLLPALMPLLARLRLLFDLDAEPAMVDGCLAQGGLGSLVRRRPGIRIPGAFDGFEVACRILLRGRVHPGRGANELARRFVRALGKEADMGIPGLTRFAPSAARVAETRPSTLVAMGLPRRRAHAMTALARMVAHGELRLEPGGDVAATHRALMQIDGVGDRLATSIVMRALGWPDAFPVPDRGLQRASGASTPGQLRERAESWRPWRAYAAVHLWLKDEERR